jgi:hypothetical protein
VAANGTARHAERPGKIASHGQMAWQKCSGYNLHAKVEAAIDRYKRGIGNTLRSRTDQTAIAAVFRIE